MTTEINHQFQPSSQFNANLHPAELRSSDYLRSEEEISEKIRTISAELLPSLLKAPKIIYNTMIEPAGVMNSKDRTLTLSAFQKIKKLPSHLQVESRNDARLDSQEFLQSASDWFRDSLNFRRFQIQKPKPSEQEKLQIDSEISGVQKLLLFFSKPELADRGMEHVLRHEIAHFQQHKSNGIRPLFLTSLFTQSKGILILFAAVLLFVLVSLLVLHLPLLPILLPSVGVFLLIFCPLLYAACSRASEEEADLIAIQSSPDLLDGVAHYHDCFTEEETSNPCMQWFKRPFLSHPPDEERLHSMQRFVEDISSV